MNACSLLKGLEPHNTMLYFRKLQTMQSAYGITRECEVLLHHVDEGGKIVSYLNEGISK